MNGFFRKTDAWVPLSILSHLLRAGSNWPLWALLAIFVAIVLSGRIILAEGSEWHFWLYDGLLAGQMAVLAVWAVFGTRRLLVRWPLALLGVALIWTIVFVWLFIIPEGSLPDWAYVRYFLQRQVSLLPLYFLAIQLPLWILKAVVGSRIARDEAGSYVATAPLRQFHLQHLFGVTTVVAVAMGLASLSLPKFRPQGWDIGESPDDWLGVFIVCMVFALLSALTAVPGAWAALIARRKWRAAIILLGYTLLLAPVLVSQLTSATAAHVHVNILLAIVLASQDTRMPLPWVYAYFLSFCGGIISLLFISLRILRSRGWILVWPEPVASSATVQAPARDAALCEPTAENQQPPAEPAA